MNESVQSIETRMRPVERHLQTLIVVIIVGLLGWVGTTVQETQVAVARLTVEIEFLKRQMNIPASKFTEIESRLDRIENQLLIHMNGKISHSEQK